MQADWEIEIGGDAPVIEAAWTGFVDLCASPKSAYQLPENIAFPPLAQTLILLNATESPVRTSKCDVWTMDSLSEVGFDHYDLDAGLFEAHDVVGCYIDLFSPNDKDWRSPEGTVTVAKTLCTRLAKVQLKCSRVDLVVRQALVTDDDQIYGITAYFTACGSAKHRAQDTLAAALCAFADTVLAPAAQNSAKQS